MFKCAFRPRTDSLKIRDDKLRQLPNDVRGYSRKRRRSGCLLRTANGSAGLLRVMACDSSVCGISLPVGIRAVPPHQGQRAFCVQPSGLSVRSTIMVALFEYNNEHKNILKVCAAETGRTGKIDSTARFISDDLSGLLSLSLMIRACKQSLRRWRGREDICAVEG
jgi:hypothetical protein